MRYPGRTRDIEALFFDELIHSEYIREHLREELKRLNASELNIDRVFKAECKDILFPNSLKDKKECCFSAENKTLEVYISYQLYEFLYKLHFVKKEKNDTN